MAIKLIDDKELWDSFVDQSHDGLLFHKWDSLKIMEKYTNCKLLTYGIYNGEELICIFPLFLRKSRGLKTIFSPPPQTGIPRLGFVMNKEFYNLKQSKKEIYLDIVAKEFDEEIKKILPNYINISLVENFLDIRSFKWCNYNTDVHHIFMLDLNLSLDEIWNGFTHNLRNQIKRANGLNLKLLQNKDIHTFFELEKKRYEEKGLDPPITNKNYLKDLFDKFPENLKFMCLYNNDNDILSVQVNCEYKDSFMQWMGGPIQHQKNHYDEFSTWEFIKQAKQAGYKKFDWGGGTKTIMQFKSKFNPELGIYFTINKKDILGKFAESVYLNLIHRIYRYK